MSVSEYTPATPGDFFCPAGGTWYACEKGTKFIGCCLSDPCVNGCFADQLRPAGVSTTIYNQYPGGSCGGSTDFWTCLSAPTFWGCCNSDPCMNNSTCATGHLEPTFMDRPDQLEYFHALNLLLSSSVSSSAASSTASLSGSPVSSGAVSSTAASNSSNSSQKGSGAIIGGAVGGGIALLVIIAIIVLLLRRRKRRKQEHAKSEAAEQAAMQEVQNKGFYGGVSSPQISPPPTYSFDQVPFHQNPQELPTEPPDSTRSRHSELQGGAASYRFSELSGATAPRELESPGTSPRPPQTDFTSDHAKQPARGLGLTAIEENGKR